MFACVMLHHDISVKVWFIMLFGLCKKETKRIFRIFNQTIIAPCVESLLIVLIIGTAIKGDLPLSEFLSFGFLIGGVSGSLIIKNAFSNASSVLVISKVAGYFNDYLIPPFGKTHIFLSIIFGSILRSVASFLIFLPLVSFCTQSLSISHPVLLMSVCVGISVLFGAIGIMIGLVVDGFERMSMFLSYVVTPLSMFSGSFFGIDKFPLVFQKLFLFSPFFYAIDVIKYCFTDVSYLDISVELWVLFACIAFSVFLTFCVLMFTLRTERS